MNIYEYRKLIGKTIVDVEYFHSSGEVIVTLDDDSKIWLSMWSKILLAHRKDLEEQREKEALELDVEEELRQFDRCGFCGARRMDDCNNVSLGAADGAGGACRWREEDVLRG